MFYVGINSKNKVTSSPLRRRRYQHTHTAHTSIHIIFNVVYLRVSEGWKIYISPFVEFSSRAHKIECCSPIYNIVFYYYSTPSNLHIFIINYHYFYHLLLFVLVIESHFQTTAIRPINIIPTRTMMSLCQRN